MAVLQTERLRLCQLSIQDAAFILELLNTPSWLTFIGDRGIRTLDDARNYILNGPVTSYNQFGFGLYLVRLKENDLPIGLCGLLKRETLKDIDIGFAFMPQFTQKGYAYEAASCVMNYARTVLNVTRIVAITTAANRNSINLLERLGLRFEAIIPQVSDTEELLLFGIN